MSMRRSFSLLFAASFLFATGGCSDSAFPIVSDHGVGSGDQTIVDQGVGGEQSLNDQMLSDGQPTSDVGLQADTTPASKSALQAVMNKLLVPLKKEDYAYDLDKNGTKDNQLGAILGFVLGFAGSNVDLQAQIDHQVQGGSLLFLFDLIGDSVVNLPSLTIGMGQGVDLDSDPLDNFSGTEEFRVASSGMIKVNGSITNGKLVGDGDVTMAIPLGMTPAIVTLKKGHLEADVSATGMVNGQISGAIPMDQVNTILIPAIAGTMNDPTMDPTIKSMLDTDQDGTVTADELRNNILLAFLLNPDIDTDGKNGPDAFSIGVGFTAVPCKIQPY
ncbi:MAG: hypothetical protein KAI47_24565 [Deltaproteobacteria bacterium]|nr:hypothetical protein [Deltaproteobacteria bacterium]